MNFLLTLLVGISGAYIGFNVCETPAAGWWVGVITAYISLINYIIRRD